MLNDEWTLNDSLGHKEIVKASKAKMTTASAISVGEARGHG